MEQPAKCVKRRSMYNAGIQELPARFDTAEKGDFPVTFLFNRGEIPIFL